MIAFVVGFFSIGAMSERRRSTVALVIALAVAVFPVDPLTLNNYLAIALSSIVLPWLLGLLWLRRRTAQTDERRRRREAAESAVAVERLRLAQELHDTVSHNVGMIAVQAGAADILLDKGPAASRESLQAMGPEPAPPSSSSGDCSGCCAQPRHPASRARCSPNCRHSSHRC